MPRRPFQPRPIPGLLRDDVILDWFLKGGYDAEQIAFFRTFVLQLREERENSNRAARWHMILQYSAAILSAVAAALTGAIAVNVAAGAWRFVAVAATVAAGFVSQAPAIFRTGERWRLARQIVNGLELAGYNFLGSPKSADSWENFVTDVQAARVQFSRTYIDEYAFLKTPERPVETQES
jgi:hypothetical protein